MKIKELTITGKTFLAPLAGITNLPFRRLVKECGCAVVCSEMVSAKGLFYAAKKTRALMQSMDEEAPLSLQIFGADPKSMALAAKEVELTSKAAILDINFGCSVKKVVKQGAGVALMKDPLLTENLLSAVRRATTLPLTIKIRTGWDSSGGQAMETARIAEACGVNAIALHPRTATQGFRGHADWQMIEKLKNLVKIPVIGNGDITCAEDAKKMVDETGCDAVMVGRAALSNPFLLAQIDQFLTAGRYDSPGQEEIFNAMERLTRLYVAYFGEAAACKMLRGRLAWFVKGIHGASAFRRALAGIRTEKETLELILAFRSGL